MMRSTLLPGALLQRKCACGNHAVGGGECSECNKKRRFSLPAKLKIGESGDRYEKEADGIADRMSAAGVLHPAVGGAAARVQRFSGQSTGHLEAAPASVEQALATPGRPLEPGLRRDMEQRFGHDFSSVLVHSGAAAEQSARDVNAQAYTVGHDIVFGAGRFAPATHEGRRLLAHELSHIVQQAGLQMPRVQRQSLAGGFPRGTNYRFDTYRITESDLSDPDIVARLRRLSPDQLRNYLGRVTDPAVQDYIRKLLAAPGSIPKPQDPVDDCLFNFASFERVSRIVGPRLDVFDCYDALAEAAAKGRPSLTPEAACAQCLVTNAKMDLDTAWTTCRDELLNQCIAVTESWKRFVRRPF
ncbi:MAG: DUF4157 domain-containing protein [Gammaproteobacteria bacterium]